LTAFALGSLAAFTSFLATGSAALGATGAGAATTAATAAVAVFLVDFTAALMMLVLEEVLEDMERRILTGVV
jgi:hypothetical protein